ncbi:MAG TPA: hypothetical protein VIP78_13605 [Candidatus Dormibacteraeota bacterium]|jgi:hypothetical protein
MIDQGTIRKQLAEFRTRLEQLDNEREAIQGIVSGYETLLRTMGTEAEARPRQARAEPKTGTVSMRSAVRRVLMEATEPLHSRDILARAQGRGATTAAKEPSSVVDLVVLGLSQKGLVVKTAPRTWRWVGTPEKGDGAPM